MTEHSQNWRPGCHPDTLKQRARLLNSIRGYFAEQDVLEVDTPCLSRAGNSDVHIDNLRITGPTSDWFLQTSPEYPMKRLLAAGSGSIYQICKVFRAGEQGSLHNPEFTMLEWYRVGFSMRELIDDVDALLRRVCQGHLTLADTLITSYQDLFEHELGIDPITASVTELQESAGQHGIEDAARLEMEYDEWLDLIMSSCLIPRLGEGRPCFVYGYPASQAALAQLDPHRPQTAQRFELFINGIELANGYHELRDATEQAQRFQRDLQKRQQLGKPAVPLDQHLLAALQHGLPDCSGVALGLDRLLLLMTGSTSISEVLTFDSQRA